MPSSNPSKGVFMKIRLPLFAALALTLTSSAFAGETRIEIKPFGKFIKITVSGSTKDDCEVALAQELERAVSKSVLVTSAVGCGAEAVYWHDEMVNAGSVIISKTPLVLGTEPSESPGLSLPQDR